MLYFALPSDFRSVGGPLIPQRMSVRLMVCTFVMLLLAPIAASAQDGTFRFSGTITETYNSPFADIEPGTPVTGVYTFNLGAPDENSFPTVGDYWHRGPPHGVILRVGNRVFKSNPASVEFLIEVANNHSNSDNYLFISYNNQQTDGVDVGPIYWQLDDPTQTVLSSPALLATPPVLSQWLQIAGLYIDGPSSDYQIRG